MPPIACKEIIDKHHCPIDELGNPRRQALIEHVRAELASDGCAVVRNFLSPAGLQALRNEAIERKPHAYYSKRQACNVYLGDGDSSLPNDHPRNIFMPRTNGFVTADLYEEETASSRLYAWEPLKQFLTESLQKEELFIYADPVSNMIVNVGKPGQEFNWHFDTNEFTITLLLEPATSGGHFEYVPNLRTPRDECYEAVKQVIDGDRSRVKRLPLKAGDLQFFLGRFSLHRVSKNTGDHDRLLLIMSFAEKPNMVGSRVRVKDLYGKLSNAHCNTTEQRVRADGLLD